MNLYNATEFKHGATLERCETPAQMCTDAMLPMVLACIVQLSSDGHGMIHVWKHPVKTNQSKDDAMIQCLHQFSTAKFCAHGCQEYTDCMYDWDCTTGELTSAIESMRIAEIFG